MNATATKTEQSDFPFIIFKEVASAMWPGIGMYRARYCAGTELYGEWSDKAAAEQVSYMPNASKFERVTKATWDAARAGQMNGWCEESDADAFVYREPLTEEGRAIAAADRIIEADHAPKVPA